VKGFELNPAFFIVREAWPTRSLSNVSR
jgi:hypothetical protein